MLLRFTKFVGAGNDFVILDSTDQQMPSNTPDFARFVCSRHLGVGADGLVILESVSPDYFRINCFNPDGSIATMCGNALRCCAAFAMQNFSVSSPILEICGNPVKAVVHHSSISISFPKPHSFREVGILDNREVFFINTGTEHVVTFVESVNDIDVIKEGAKLRNHSLFAPCGANINFAQIENASTIINRTYERGVEAETLSCGSGSVASALISRHTHRTTAPEVRVLNRSDSPLCVSFDGEALPFTDIWLSGSADRIFQGELEWPH